jgi:hypothetical protein
MKHGKDSLSDTQYKDKNASFLRINMNKRKKSRPWKKSETQIS